MKKYFNHKISLRSFLFSFLFLTVGFANAQPFSSEINEKINLLEQNIGGRSLQDAMTEKKVPGLSIAVIHNYKIEWTKAYGLADMEENRQVTTETRFQAASISKSINSIGVLKLVQENKIDLERNVNDYIRSWKLPSDSKITSAQLLSHTAGLSVHGFPGYNRSEKLPTAIEILNGNKSSRTEPVRPAFEPGRKYQYSGGGTLVSQVMISDLTNEPYERYMTENVLQPLGMSNSFYSAPSSREEKNLASAYVDNIEVEGKYRIYPEMAAAGLWTTPSDLAKFIIGIQTSNKEARGFLSRISVSKMLNPVKGNSALGVFVKQKGKETYFYHSGVNEGFSAYYFAGLESGNGVVVMMNSNYNSLLEEIIQRVAQIYKWEGFKEKEIQP